MAKSLSKTKWGVLWICLLFMPMMTVSIVAAQPRCPMGYYWFRGRCVPRAGAGPSCPPGFHWFRGSCVRNYAGPSCPPGFYFFRGRCLRR